MLSTTKPDPRRGIFETLLVVAGTPVELTAHLRRLAASLEALYGTELPAEARGLLQQRAAGLHLGRVRLTVAPRAAGLACEAIAEGLDPDLHFPAWENGAELRGCRLPGGLGPHKWTDRSRLPAAAETVPLLLDSNDDVLEAGWANVFSVQGGVVATPPLDGRILPGVTRAAAIKIARQEGFEVEERRIKRDELLEAEEVFLTGSVRGVQPARSLDGDEIARGEVARLLGSGLARRYGTSRTWPVELSRSA